MTTVADAPAVGHDDDDPRSQRRTPWSLVVAAGAGAFIVLYLAVALLRIRYPYELEWIEGGMVNHVAQIRDGHQLYGAPSLAFTPDIYTPLYFYVAAAVSVVTGLGFFPLRLVSLVSSIVLFVVLGKLVHRETSDRASAVLGAGLFAACYRIGGAWLDIGRVDTLCLALLFSGMLVARDAKTKRAAIGAGALISLAFLAKQVALLPALAIIVFLLVARRGRAVAASYAATVAVGIGGSTLAFDAVTNGWYSVYIFRIPAKHEIADGVYTSFFTDDLLKPLLAALVLAGVGLFALRRARSEGFWLHAIVGTAIVAAAYSARLHTGGYDNVLLPMYAELAVVAAFGVHHLLAHRSRWVPAVVTAVALAQLAHLLYNPMNQLSRPANDRAGAATIAALRTLPSPAYLPGHPWYLVDVGQQGTAQGAALEDVFRAHYDGTDRALAQQLWAAVADRRFAAIVVESGEGFSYLPDNVCRFYRPDHPLVPGAVLLPITGTMTGPDMVWLPKDEPGAQDCNAIGNWTVGPNG